MAVTTYCVRNDLKAIVGESVILTAIDDNQDGVEPVDGHSYVTAAIEQAAVEMNQALRNQYKLTDLASNGWCKYCNAYLAVWFLCARRNNVPPPSVVDAVQTYREQLEQIRWGRFQVPEVAPSFEHIPTVTNFQPELGKTEMPIRVDTDESTGAAPASESRRKRKVANIPGWTV